MCSTIYFATNVQAGVYNILAPPPPRGEGKILSLLKNKEDFRRPKNRLKKSAKTWKNFDRGEGGGIFLAGRNIHPYGMFSHGHRVGAMQHLLNLYHYQKRQLTFYPYCKKLSKLVYLLQKTS